MRCSSSVSGVVSSSTLVYASAGAGHVLLRPYAETSIVPLSAVYHPSPPKIIAGGRSSPPRPGISAQRSLHHPIARLAPQCSLCRVCLRRSVPRFGPEAHPPCSQHPPARRRREALTHTPDASEPSYLSPWSWHLSAYSKPQSSPRADAPNPVETGAALDDSGVESTHNNRHQQWLTKRSPRC
jgi:hypothetical protein